MTTEEGNRLIAESPFGDCKIDDKEKIYKYVRQRESWALQGLKYHSSWDWLMPVWAKLGKEMYKIRQYISGDDYKQAEIFTINILKSFQKVDINSAFNWITEAIQWYNNQSKTNT